MDSKRNSDPVILSSSQEQSRDSGLNPRQGNWLPWAAAGAVILLGLGTLLLVTRHSHPRAQPGGAHLAVADPYAASLPISEVKMSEASNFAGSKVTYIDGSIANIGTLNVTGVTIQLAFHNELGELSQKETMALNLIRTREPYVDTQPVSAAPIQPGQTREFRLILDHVTMDWDQRYPELRVVDVKHK